MTRAVELLKHQADTLSAEERADLAYQLLSTLEPEESGANEAWASEIGRRYAEVERGTAVGRPVEEVLAELSDRYK